MVTDSIMVGNDGVSIRCVTAQDCTDRYLAWMTDVETNQYMETRWVSHTLESIREFVDSVRKSTHSYLFAIIYDGMHVGNIKIGPIHPRYMNADISYFIGEKSVRERGVASEAIRLAVNFGFAALGLHRIQAGVFRENLMSQKALERNGFRLDGVFREKYFLKSGEDWTDALEYSILRSEWERSCK